MNEDEKNRIYNNLFNEILDNKIDLVVNDPYKFEPHKVVDTNDSLLVGLPIKSALNLERLQKKPRKNTTIYLILLILEKNIKQESRLPLVSIYLWQIQILILQ